jgi:dolichyl-phosphate-mannose-protein mannosyltransferase
MRVSPALPLCSASVADDNDNDNKDENKQPDDATASTAPPPPPSVDLTPKPHEEIISEPQPHWTLAHIVALILVILFAGALRFVRLDVPKELIFDENHYAPRACLYVHPDEDACTAESEPAPEVHPPLGNWLISAGIRLFGFDSFGWRFLAALAGTISAALMFLMARHLFKSLFAGIVAAGLLAIDPLHFVQSRVAMLDIFVPMFGFAALLFLLYDRDRMHADAEAGRFKDEPVGRGNLIDRPWRFAVGAAAGAAIASKWSGALILVLVVALTFAWEIASRRLEGTGNVFRRTLREELPSIVLWLFLLPVVIYALTYIGRVEGTVLAAPWSEGAWLRALWDQQAYMLDFHIDFDSTHSYGSPAWSWLLLKRPVAYAYDATGGQIREVMALGNPFTWWASILALIYVAVRWVRAIEFTRPEGFIIAGFIFTYLPWFLVTRRDVSFVFYLLPTLPFMFLAIALVLRRIFETWEGKAATAIFAVGAIASFAFYYPVIAYAPLDQKAWDKRITPVFFNKYKMFADCAKPLEAVEVTETGVDKTIIRTQTTTDTDAPPDGWCWI